MTDDVNSALRETELAQREFGEQDAKLAAKVHRTGKRPRLASLVACADCTEDISRRAHWCPKCGAPGPRIGFSATRQIFRCVIVAWAIAGLLTAALAAHKWDPVTTAIMVAGIYAANVAMGWYAISRSRRA